MNHSLYELFKVKLSLKRRSFDSQRKNDEEKEVSKTNELKLMEINNIVHLNSTQEETCGVFDHRSNKSQLNQHDKALRTFQKLKHRVSSLPDAQQGKGHQESSNSVSMTSTECEQNNGKSSKFWFSNKSWLHGLTHGSMRNHDIYTESFVNDSFMDLDTSTSVLLSEGNKRERFLSISSDSKKKNEYNNAIEHPYARAKLGSDSVLELGRLVTSQDQEVEYFTDCPGVYISELARRRSKTVSAMEHLLGSNKQINRHSTNSPLMRLRSASLLSDQQPFKRSDCRMNSNTSSSTPLSGFKRNSSLVNVISSFVTLKSSSVSTKVSNEISMMEPLNFLSGVPKPSVNDSYDDYLKIISSYGRYISVILCDDNNEFKLHCLDMFINSEFNFVNEPLDISLRKLLYFMELPKESQQIDRLLYHFSKVYFEQNFDDHADQMIWKNVDQVYFIAYSLLMLHTDWFNSKNKNKITKCEFIKLIHSDSDSGGNKVPKELLQYFYDNTINKEFPPCIISSDNIIGNQCDLPNSNISEALDMSYMLQAVKPQKNPYKAEFWTQTRSAANTITSYFSGNNPSPRNSTSLNIQLFNEEIDPYFHIMNVSLNDVKLKHEIFRLCELPDLSVNFSDLELQLYKKYLSVMKDLKGGYLKFDKTHISSLLHCKWELTNPNKLNDGDNRFLKVVHMGEFEEIINSKRFSIVGNGSRLSWKKYFVILTTCGLLLFENMDLLETTIEIDSETNISNYIIDCTDSNVKNSLLKVWGTNGLFADMINIDNDILLIDIYSNNEKHSVKFSNASEQKVWVSSINLVASLDNCYLNFESIPNTIGCIQKVMVDEKFDKLNKICKEKLDKLTELKSYMNFCENCIPLHSKTKLQMLTFAKQLSVKIRWIIYEIKKNRAYIQILESLGLNSLTGENTDSLFSEPLDRCFTEKSIFDTNSTFSMSDFLQNF